MPHAPARAVACLILLAAALPRAGTAQAQERPPLPDLTGIVKDDGWARILGKALFWDTVAAANGAGCGACHFVGGADRRIPDQSANPLEPRRVSAQGQASQREASQREASQREASQREASQDVALDRFSLDGGTRAVIDVCSRRVSLLPREIADSGPVGIADVRTVGNADPSCGQDTSIRLAHAILEHRPLGGRSIGPDDGTFGRSGPHGNLISPTGRGLDRSYQWMIQQAFDDSLWSAASAASPAGSAPSSAGSAASSDDRASSSAATGRIEKNFPLFRGIALIVYESTLDPNWSHSQEHGQRTDSPVPLQPRFLWE